MTQEKIYLDGRTLNRSVRYNPRGYVASNGLRLNTFRPNSRLGFFVAYTFHMKSQGKPVTARGFFEKYMSEAGMNTTGRYRRGYGCYFTAGIIKTGLFKVVGKGTRGEYQYDFGPAMNDRIYESLGLISLTPNYQA
jgi:hypothetical protein